MIFLQHKIMYPFVAVRKPNQDKPCAMNSIPLTEQIKKIKGL